MLIYALVGFVNAAVGGVVLAAHVLHDKFARWALSNDSRLNAQRWSPAVVRCQLQRRFHVVSIP